MVDRMQHLNVELATVNGKYNSEIVAHQKLNADLEIYKLRLSTYEEQKTPHFYDFFTKILTVIAAIS